MLLRFLGAFLVGGVICLTGEILIINTKLTPARILTAFVVAGVILSALGVYGYIEKIGFMGAAVPLTGFGNAIAKGVKDAIETDGIFGILTGVFKNTGGGITFTVFLAVLSAFFFKSKSK